jgi:site-specific DNA-adenine methylase
MSYYNFFKYAGNKTKYLDLILPLIKKSKKKIYIEPFLGSATIFFNSPPMDEYIINDKSVYITNILHTFNNIEYIDLFNFYNDKLLRQFGNIGENKDSYDNFKHWVNSLPPSDEKNLGTFYLGNSCINSFGSLGNNGNFTQGYGERGTTVALSIHDFDYIKKRLCENVTIMNVDYSLLLPYDSTEVLWVLDPPYNDAPFVYNSGFVFTNFQTFVQQLTGDIIYFDTENTFGDNYFPYKTLLRRMPNVSPSNKGGTLTTYQNEIMYSTIPSNNISLF